MTREHRFSWPVRRLALLGLAGVAVFGAAIIALHLTGSGVDWTSDYVSDLANQPFGWLFMVGAFVHGWGNLALTLARFLFLSLVLALAMACLLAPGLWWRRRSSCKDL